MKIVGAGMLLAGISGVILTAAAETAELQPVKPRVVRALVADGQHNAFTAMVRWKDQYWLAFRKGQAHNSSMADVILLRSVDAENWAQARVVDLQADDRDPQFLATPRRLFLYVPGMQGGRCTSYATCTEDGTAWTAPRPVYEPLFILWKPLARGNRYYATAHRKAEGKEGGKVREVHLITSVNGMDWEKVSTIRAGNWESETTLHFESDTRLLAFLRQKYSTPGYILESSAPFTEWAQRPAGVHLSGHIACTFDGKTYVLSRTMAREGNGTMIYLWMDDKLQPYCALPSGGDCSYPAAVPIDREMLVSYYSSHEGSTNIYLARVPLAP